MRTKIRKQSIKHVYIHLIHKKLKHLIFVSGRSIIFSVSAKIYSLRTTILVDGEICISFFFNNKYLGTEKVLSLVLL